MLLDLWEKRVSKGRLESLEDLAWQGSRELLENLAFLDGLENRDHQESKENFKLTLLSKENLDLLDLKDLMVTIF